MKLLFNFILIYLIQINVNAQNVSGEWTGNYGKSFMMLQPQKLVVEIFIHNDSIVTGASHLIYKGKFYEHYKIKGKYNSKDSTINFIEDSTIGIKLGWGAGSCKGNYIMKLKKVSDTLLRLEGMWTDRYRGIFRCPKSTVWLEKKIINQTPLSAPNNKEEDKVKTRFLDIQSLLEFKQEEKDSIKIEVYDNGEIDDDFVSVYCNDSLVIANKKITTQPLTFYVSLLQSSVITKIKLVAESQGKIPPCTALMVVTSKNKRYEVSLSSDYYKNGAIEFFLKE